MRAPSTSSSVNDKIDAFFSTYPKHSYPKGQILIFADEEPPYIFYIKEGLVRKYDVSYRGDEVVVNLFKPPAFFPMSWAINRTPNTYFYKTELASVLHIVPAEDALAFIKDNPDVMFDLLARVYRGSEGMLGRLVHLMSGTAQSRLIYELILETRRFSTANKDKTFTLSANESDLAARTGLSRETVSREIQKLKDSHAVDVIAGHVTVTDLQALEQKLGAGI